MAISKRNALENVIAGRIDAETIEWAQAALEKMDAQNEARKNKVTAKQAENMILVEKIVNEILSEEAVTASDIGAALEISTQKASALARKAVAEGAAEQIDVKIKGKGTVKAYRKVENA